MNYNKYRKVAMIIKILVLAIAIIMYLGLILFPRRKVLITLFASFIIILSGAITLKEAFLELINWNVLLIYLGTLILADLFILSRVPAMMADIIINKSPNTGLAITLLCVLTGLISMFVENVATVLVVAPLAIDIAKKLKISPVPILFVIAMSSNLQGTATLVGDPPSMIFAGFCGLNFNDFFVYNGKPSIFFIVEAGAIVSCVFIYLLFRKYKQKEVIEEVATPISYVPLFLLILMVAGLALISFLEKGFSIKSGILCFTIGTLGLMWYAFFHKGSPKEVYEILKKLDWEIVLFLIGIFIVVGSISKAGILEDISKLFVDAFGNNVLASFLAITFVSMLLSGFIDNVPYIVLMLPVVKNLAIFLGTNEFLLYSGLLVGSCLGGNITPFGASANIVAVGILKKEGYETKFSDFVKIGLPFTISATLAAASLAWIIWR
jgi:Na+/H+ antiporter NhaD/arsenite permease-like protein